MSWQSVNSITPDTFAQVIQKVDALKAGNSIWINTGLMGAETAKSAIYFLMGAAYVLNCEVVEIQDNLYLVYQNG